MNMEGLVSHAIQTNGELRKLLLVDGRPYPLPELFEAIADDYQRLSGSEGRSECSPTWCLWPGQESRVYRHRATTFSQNGYLRHDAMNR